MTKFNQGYVNHERTIMPHGVQSIFKEPVTLPRSVCFYDRSPIRYGKKFSKPDVSQDKDDPCMAECHWGHKHCEHCPESKPLKEKEVRAYKQCGMQCRSEYCVECQPPSPIKGETQSVHEGIHDFKEYAPQPQSEEYWKWHEEFQDKWLSNGGEELHADPKQMEDWIENLLKSQRENYQQEIVGKIRSMRLCDACYEERKRTLAILEQEKDE